MNGKCKSGDGVFYNLHNHEKELFMGKEDRGL